MTNLVQLNSLLHQDELDETVAAIASVQQPSGMIPWTTDQHADPWNHTEAAMALTVGEAFDQARHAYEWLATTQSAHGAWHSAYWPDGSIKERRIDCNFVACVATGSLHFYRSTDDMSFAERMFSVVDKALDFVLAQQRRSGVVAWSVDEHGVTAVKGLVAGSSSVFHSLVAGLHLAEALGIDRPKWHQGAVRLARAIAVETDEFFDKSHYAMDWYYPVLSGAIGGTDGHDRLLAGASQFLIEEKGVLCRSDRRWVTTAETAEYAMALHRIGEQEQAIAMLANVQLARDDSGAYATGLVYPERVEFPAGERTTYSAAAVVLANAVVSQEHVTESIFTLSLDDLGNVFDHDDLDGEIFEGACG